MRNQNKLEAGNSFSFSFLDLLRMISPVFVGPLLTFALPKLIPANAGSSCDAQGQPGRSQHATDYEVREGYFLFAIRLNCEHVIFLLVEFSWSPALRLIAETDSGLLVACIGWMADLAERIAHRASLVLASVPGLDHKEGISFQSRTRERRCLALAHP